MTQPIHHTDKITVLLRFEAIDPEYADTALRFVSIGGFMEDLEADPFKFDATAHEMDLDPDGNNYLKVNWSILSVMNEMMGLAHNIDAELGGLPNDTTDEAIRDIVQRVFVESMPPFCTDTWTRDFSVIDIQIDRCEYMTDSPVGDELGMDPNPNAPL
jgi:hypothetical protein